MLVVSLQLNRKLEPYEKEMFKFPKACYVCHKPDTRELVDCPSCPCASFCKEHKDDPFHVARCQQLGFCYDMDIASTVFIRHPPRNSIPYHTEKAYLPASIKHFIELYMNEDKTLLVNSDIQTAHTSEYLTRPLTLLHALEKLEYLPGSTMTIHVIGANLIELDGVEIWETLLHWIPSLTTLKIILVGPDLDNEKSECSICDCCMEKGMKLNLETYGLLYKEYVDIDTFVKPDIIAGFNVGIAEWENVGSPEDTWSQSLLVLPEQKCPFVLTSYTDGELKKEHARLCKVLNKKLDCLYGGKNDFSSLRPHRDYETEYVYYQNQYMMVYRNL